MEPENSDRSEMGRVGFIHVKHRIRRLIRAQMREARRRVQVPRSRRLLQSQGHVRLTPDAGDRGEPSYPPGVSYGANRRLDIARQIALEACIRRMARRSVRRRLAQLRKTSPTTMETYSLVSPCHDEIRQGDQAFKTGFYNREGGQFGCAWLGGRAIASPSCPATHLRQSVPL